MNIALYIKRISDKFFHRHLPTDDDQRQDVALPLGIHFSSLLTININSLVAAMTHGALISVNLDNLKFLPVKAISSIKIQGIDNKKIHRFYFESEASDKRVFLQTLSDVDHPENIDELLFCCSLTEPPENQKDIAFFLGKGEVGLGERCYTFSRDDLSFFLLTEEVEKRLPPECDCVDYKRINQDIEFMPPFSGSETVIFNANGSSGQNVEVMNLMPHSRWLQGDLYEQLIVGFWTVTSEDGHQITTEEQLPMAEYIFAIQLDRSNITVI
jgi:hypothetical protein